MKNLLLTLGLVVSLIISCTKSQDDPDTPIIVPPKPVTTAVVAITFTNNKYQLEAYQIVFESQTNPQKKFIITSDKADSIPFDTYRIYGSSIIPKMTWENRSQCIDAGGNICSTWVTDTLTHTIDKNYSLEIPRINTAKELAGSVDGCNLVSLLLFGLKKCDGTGVAVDAHIYKRTSQTFTTYRGTPCAPYTVCWNYYRTWIPICN